MKNRRMLKLLFSSACTIFSCLLNAQEDHKEDPHYVWFEGNEVLVQEDGIYAASNKGMIKLNVVEYDRINNRHKVLCSCLQRPGLDSAEVVSVPYQPISE